MISLYIRRISNNEIIKTIPLQYTSERYVEKVMRGMLRNMNIDAFYIDNSEVDKLGEK